MIQSPTQPIESTTRSVVGSIPNYPMPGADDLPAPQVSWRVDADRSLLLVHDMQRYFVRFFEPGPLREALTDNVSALVSAARRLGIPVAYTMQPGSMTPEQRGLIADFWGPGMRASAEDREIVRACAPRPGDIVELKWRYSAFHGNTLAEHVSGTGRDQVVVCGVFASIGCLLSACEAFSRDLETFFVGDAMADFTRDDHLAALDYAGRRCAVTFGHRQLVSDWEHNEKEDLP